MLLRKCVMDKNSKRERVVFLTTTKEKRSFSKFCQDQDISAARYLRLCIANADKVYGLIVGPACPALAQRKTVACIQEEQPRANRVI